MGFSIIRSGWDYFQSFKEWLVNDLSSLRKTDQESLIKRIILLLNHIRIISRNNQIHQGPLISPFKLIRSLTHAYTFNATISSRSTVDTSPFSSSTSSSSLSTVNATYIHDHWIIALTKKKTRVGLFLWGSYIFGETGI